MVPKIGIKSGKIGREYSPVSTLWRAGGLCMYHAASNLGAEPRTPGAEDGEYVVLGNGKKDI